MYYSILSKHRSKLMGIAILFVILFHCHSYGLMMKTSFLNSIFTIGFGGVDIFIMLSSMGITLSLLKKPTPYDIYLKKRFSRILPAFFAFMIPWTILRVIIKDAKISYLFINSSLLYYWFPKNPGKFNWYISVIFVFYAVAPMLVKRIAKMKRKVLFTFIAVLFSIALTELFLNEGIWDYVDFLYRIPAYFIGILMGFFISSDKKISYKGIITMILMSIIGIAFYVMKTKYNDVLKSILPEWIITQQAQIFIFTTLPVCILLCLFFEIIKIKPLNFILEQLGKCSLEIYLLNVSFFAEISLIKPLLPESNTMRLGFFIYLVINILAGIGIHYLIEEFERKLKTKKPLPNS